MRGGRFLCVLASSTSAPTAPPTPAPKTGGFNAGSFFGGILLGMVLMVFFYYAYKIWQRRRSSEAGYRNY
uniref:Uncharacterized protein n=1 Tax=Plectus sambesii TaxID=2011161 RepID=A0A914WY01_9BILA